MIRNSRRDFFITSLIVLMLALNSINCQASLTVHVTEGYIDGRNIMMQGHLDNGLRIGFGAVSNWPDFIQGDVGAGETVTPHFVSTGLDLRNIELSIEGMNVGDYVIGFVEAQGAPLTFPSTVSPVVTIQGPAWFNIEIYTYPHQFEMTPLQSFVASGTGSVTVDAIAALDNGAPHYMIQNVRYSFSPTANVEEEVVPEPSTLIVWSLLGTSLAVLTYQHRR